MLRVTGNDIDAVENPGLEAIASARAFKRAKSLGLQDNKDKYLQFVKEAKADIISEKKMEIRESHSWG